MKYDVRKDSRSINWLNLSQIEEKKRKETYDMTRESKIHVLYIFKKHKMLKSAIWMYVLTDEPINIFFKNVNQSQKERIFLFLRTNDTYCCTTILIPRRLIFIWFPCRLIVIWFFVMLLCGSERGSVGCRIRGWSWSWSWRYLNTTQTAAIYR